MLTSGMVGSGFQAIAKIGDSQWSKAVFLSTLI